MIKQAQYEISVLPLSHVNQSLLKIPRFIKWNVYWIETVDPVEFPNKMKSEDKKVAVKKECIGGEGKENNVRWRKRDYCKIINMISIILIF